MKRARILLADDHPLTLQGTKAILDPFHDVVATANDGKAAVAAALECKPDLAVMDITMPLLNGIEAARQMRQHLPGMKVVFITMHGNPAYLEAALAAGATGYVLKSSAGDELLEAVNQVLNGRIHVTRSLSDEHLERFVDPEKAASTLRLSSREREALQLIAEGKAAKEIAYIMDISVKTVAFHRDNLKRKLGLRTTAELTKHAIEQGLI